MKPTLFLSMPLGTSVLPAHCSSWLRLPGGVVEPSSPEMLGEPFATAHGVPGSLPVLAGSLAYAAGLAATGSRSRARLRRRRHTRTPPASAAAATAATGAATAATGKLLPPLSSVLPLPLPLPPSPPL